MTKKIFVTKRNWYRLILFAFIVLCIFGFNPSLVIVNDPHNPFFIKQTFKFENYNLHDSHLKEDLKILLPIGMTEEAVDDLLVNNAGANKKAESLFINVKGQERSVYKDERVKKSVTYGRRLRGVFYSIKTFSLPTGSVSVTALFDGNGELLDVRLHGKSIHGTDINRISFEEVTGER